VVSTANEFWDSFPSHECKVFVPPTSLKRWRNLPTFRSRNSLFSRKESFYGWLPSLTLPFPGQFFFFFGFSAPEPFLRRNVPFFNYSGSIKAALPLDVKQFPKDMARQILFLGRPVIFRARPFMGASALQICLHMGRRQLGSPCTAPFGLWNPFFNDRPSAVSFHKFCVTGDDTGLRTFFL